MFTRSALLKKSNDFISRNFEIIVLVVAIILVNIMLYTHYADDIYFKSLTNKYSFIDFLTTRYHHWSSRLVIESLVYFFVQHTWLWRCLNLVVTFTGIYLPYLIIFGREEDQKNLNFLSIAALFTFVPVTVFNGTGWISTSLNYWWAAVALEISFVPLYKIVKKIRITFYNKLFAIAFLIYGVNQEQMAFFSFAILMFYLFYLALICKPKIKDFVFIFFQWLISTLSVGFILTCPGNYTRKIDEVRTWFRDLVSVF